MKIEGFEVMKVINPDSGHVTLCLKNEKGGPIITGKNIIEAKEKFKEAIEIMLKFQLIFRVEKRNFN